MAYSSNDVKNAFPPSDLKEIVYMCPPEGINDTKSYVCCLGRSLYGLKQVPCNGLIKSGFKQIYLDHSLFLGKTSKGITILLVYVNFSGNDLIKI